MCAVNSQKPQLKGFNAKQSKLLLTGSFLATSYVVSFVLFFASFLFTNSAIACDFDSTLANDYANSDVVITGTVTEIVPSEKMLIKTIESFKGKVSTITTVDIHDSKIFFECIFTPQVGKKYLFYLKYDKDRALKMIISGSGGLDFKPIQQDIKKLRNLKINH